jgi:nitrogen fixation NifU-like protein
MHEQRILYEHNKSNSPAGYNNAMYSARLLDHFRHPRHVGTLEPPAVTVEVSNPACGDILRLSVELQENRIARAAYQVRGCTASIACGSALAEWLSGRSLSELPAFNAALAESLVDGLPVASRHAAALCADAVRTLQLTSW